MSSLLNVNGDVELELSVPKGLDRMYRQMVSDVVRACGTRYGFDAELALKELNIIEGKDVKGKGEGKGKGSVKGEGKGKGKGKCVVTFPYSEVLCEGKCVGLRLNHGLYSQCMGELLVGGVGGVDLCECCVKQGVSNGRGVPDYGMWRDREGKFDGYVDSKGRSPVSYLKVMVRNGWTRDMVEDAALRNGVTVDVRHFAIVEGKKRGKKVSVKEVKEVKSRGRPKKSDKVVERGDGVDELSDLFAQLQHEVEVEMEVEVEEEKVFEVEVPLKKKGETAEERVIRKNAEKCAKSISKSSKSSKSTSSSSSASVSSSMDVDAITRVSNIIASVAVPVVPVVSVSSESVVPMVKESIKSVDVSSGSKLVDKKALKDASKLEEKMLKEASKLKEKALKDASKLEEKALKEASKLKEKALKEASKVNVSKKVTKKVEDKVVVEKVVEELVSTTVFDSIAVSSRDTIEDEEDGELELEELELEDEDEEEEEEDDDDSLLSSNPEVDEATVYPFNHKGVEYLHSISSGVIYDKDTHDAIGKLNKDTNTIDLFEEEEEDDEDEDEIEDRC
jgi:hypothetical protein